MISCKLKTTVLTRSVFIFSKLSYFNLNFGIKQSKIGCAEHWLPKAKISEPVDDRRPEFLKMYQFKAAISLQQNSLERNIFVNLEDTRLFYLVIKLTNLLALPKGRAT